MISKLLLASSLFVAVLGGDDDFVLCKFRTCPEVVMQFAYNESAPATCVGSREDCDNAIAYSKANHSLETIQNDVCAIMETWVGKKTVADFACFDDCPDPFQIQSHFDISNFTRQDCNDYVSLNINPPPPYYGDDYGSSDYGDDDDKKSTDKDDDDGTSAHNSEVDENADGAITRTSNSATKTIGTALVAVGVVALALAAVLAVRTRASNQLPALKPNMDII